MEMRNFYLQEGALANQNGFFIRSDHDQDYILRKKQSIDQPIEKITSGGAKGPGITHIDSTSTTKLYGADGYRLIPSWGQRHCPGWPVGLGWRPRCFWYYL